MFAAVDGTVDEALAAVLASVPTPPIAFVGIAPCRLADTRGNGFSGAYGPPALAGQASRVFPVAGHCGIPASAQAVSMNMAVTNTSAIGFIAIWPEGAAPDTFEALSMLIYARQRVCDWSDLDALFERQRTVLRWPDAPPVVPHNLLALPYTAAELYTVAQNWAKQRVAPETRPRPSRPASRDGRLRIAYLGSDFRAHAIANLLPEVIERHDRTRFEVIAYSFGPDDGSAAPGERPAHVSRHDYSRREHRAPLTARR
jgi:hypothetical protein